MTTVTLKVAVVDAKAIQRALATQSKADVSPSERATADRLAAYVDTVVRAG